MRQDKRKIEYSKILPTVSMILFVITLTVGFIAMFYLILNGIETVYDLAFFISGITITGGIWSMTNKYYYSKTGLQNVASIRKSTYEEVMNVRLKYIEEVVKLKKKYNIDDDEINSIDSDAPFEELSNSALSSITNKLDEVDNQNSAEPENNLT